MPNGLLHAWVNLSCVTPRANLLMELAQFVHNFMFLIHMYHSPTKQVYTTDMHYSPPS